MEIKHLVLEIWLFMNQLNTSAEAVEEHYQKRLVQYSQHLPHSSEVCCSNRIPSFVVIKKAQAYLRTYMQQTVW